MSLGASCLAVAVCGWLYVEGMNDPRRYTSAMTRSHHNGAYSHVSCLQCHVPKQEGGFATTPTCLTSGCHGEMAAGISDEAVIASVKKANEAIDGYGANPDKRLYFVRLHEALKSRACYECHTEHTMRDQASTKTPANWVTFEEWKTTHK